MEHLQRRAGEELHPWRPTYNPVPAQCYDSPAGDSRWFERQGGIGPGFGPSFAGDSYCVGPMVGALCTASLLLLLPHSEKGTLQLWALNQPKTRLLPEDPLGLRAPPPPQFLGPFPEEARYRLLVLTMLGMVTRMRKIFCQKQRQL